MARTSITHNLGQVLDDFRIEIARHNGRAVEAVKKTALGALGDLQTTSPVDTGRYRASHTLTMDRPSDYVPPDTDAGASGALAQSQTSNAEATLAGMRDLSGVTIFIASNLEYANAIENGHSVQAPQGVYAIAHKRAEARFRQIAKGADF